MHRVRINIVSSLETRRRRCWIKVCADKRFAPLPKSMFVCVEMGEGSWGLGWWGGGVKSGAKYGSVSTDVARCLPLFHGQHFAGCPMLVKCHSV